MSPSLERCAEAQFAKYVASLLAVCRTRDDNVLVAYLYLLEASYGELGHSPLNRHSCRARNKHS